MSTYNIGTKVQTNILDYDGKYIIGEIIEKNADKIKYYSSYDKKWHTLGIDKTDIFRVIYNA